jgi:polyhydroxybutyrate depolymerase
MSNISNRDLSVVIGIAHFRLQKEIRTVFLFFLALFFHPGNTTAQVPLRKLHAPVKDSIIAGKLERVFWYYVSDSVMKNPDLLFVLHGSTMTGREMEIVTGRQFDRIADTSRNLIVVYPQGYEKYWNDCRKSARYQSRLEGVNDVDFIAKLINYFALKYHIDKKQVFVLGYSNGGEMSFKLAIERPDLFKGFAAISANLPVLSNNNCGESVKPVSMLVMNGTADPINPYNGGDIVLPDGMNRGRVVSTQQTIQYWINLSHCNSALASIFTFPDIDKTDSSTVIEFQYSCPETQKKIVLLKINNGGHTIPNPGFGFWPKVLGNVNKDINAPYLIYRYFMSLP